MTYNSFRTAQIGKASFQGIDGIATTFAACGLAQNTCGKQRQATSKPNLSQCRKVLAATTAVTHAAPERFNTRAASLHVAPVVRISSTTRARALSK